MLAYWISEVVWITEVLSFLTKFTSGAQSLNDTYFSVIMINSIHTSTSTYTGRSVWFKESLCDHR